MKVYLVRHGEAVPPEVDPEKPLSPQGREDVEKIAKGLAKNSFPLSAILHSQKLRAKQTAEIFKKYLAPEALLEEHPKLSPNDPIDSCASRIEGENEDLMVVGHLPFLSKLTSHLVTGKEEYSLVQFQAGTTVCLESGLEGWTIRWMISLDQV